MCNLAAFACPAVDAALFLSEAKAHIRGGRKLHRAPLCVSIIRRPAFYDQSLSRFVFY